MTYQIIPLQAVPNQSFGVVLDGQQALINLSTTEYGLYADIVYNGVMVANARLCLDRTDLNLARYLGLPQFLGFVDTQGVTDPVYTGFGASGARYLLVYGNPASNGGMMGA